MAGLQSAHAQTVTWTNGALDNAWNSSSADWTPMNYADGLAVQFPGSGPGGSVIVGTVTASPAGVSPASVEFTTGSDGYTFTDGTGTAGIEGAATVTLDSGYTGNVYLDAINSYTGLTTVNGGTLEVTNNGSLPTIGTGAVTLGGGTVAFNHSVTSLANPITLSSGTTSTIMGNATNDNVTDTGTISSSAGATVSNTVLNLTGGNTYTFGPTGTSNTMAGFTGTVNAFTAGGTLRFTPTAVQVAEGSQTALFNLGTSGTILQQNSTGVTLLGAIEGGTGSKIAGTIHSGNNNGNDGEFVIGGAGVNATFNGTITGNSERAVIDVTGGGSLTLTNGTSSYTTKTGTLPKYDGPGTTILGNGQQPSGNGVTNGAATFTGMPASNGGGVLYVSNASGSPTGPSPVYVEGASSAVNSGNGIAGGLLGGDGIVGGEVSTVVNSLNQAVDSATPLANFAAGSIIEPGAVGADTSETLTLSGGLYLSDWANLDFSLDVLPGDSLDALIAVSNSTDAALVNPLTLPADGNIQVNFSFPNGVPEYGVPYTLITYTGTDLGGSGVPSWTVGAGADSAHPAQFTDTGSGVIEVVFVPEPASLGLLSLGALGLLRRRRNPA
jgi:autotransporter-associated beta strand protein